MNIESESDQVKPCRNNGVLDPPEHFLCPISVIE